MVIENIKTCNCEESLCCCGRLALQSSSATVGQDQTAFELNNSMQTAAIAIATDGGTAKASQQLCQSNRNLRSSAAIATSCTTLDCSNICDSSNTSASATDQQNRQDVQANFNGDLVNVALAGEGGTAISRECTQQPNVVNEIRTTIATSCPGIEATQPDNLNQESVNVQHRSPENLDSVLTLTPLSSVNINGRVISIKPRNQSPTIKQVAYSEKSNDEGNAKKAPLVLSFDEFHVILNLDGISMDAITASDGEVLVNRKGVRR